MERITFNRPYVAGPELNYIQQALDAHHLSGDGEFTRRCRDLLEQSLNVKRVLLTTSCTHALEMAAMLLDFGEGDEVIIPAFTFVSTVNAFVLRGARPVFADIRADTLNIDETQLARLLTPRTKAMVVVHYAGVGCVMDTILAVAQRHNLKLVEDNAHGLFGKYKDGLLGTFGVLATQSFHETKNIHCGEGGAPVINDETLIDRAEILREKGTNRSRFFRGQIDKYTWVDIGSSCLPPEILAAYLLAQLEARHDIQQKRQTVWTYYQQHLQDWAAQAGVGLPCVPAHCEQPFHMFYLLLPSQAQRQRFIDHLARNQVQSVFHYLPLHLSDMGRRYGGRLGQCPVTEDISDRLVRLPFHNTLTESNLEQVVSAVTSYESV